MGLRFWAACLAVSSTALAANAPLQRAQTAFDAHQYKPAEKALFAALLIPGNDRATLIRIYELEGLVAGFLNQPDKAKAAFRALLALDPNHALARDYAPRVMDPFHDAQRWVEQNAALKVDAALASPLSNGKTSLAVVLTADPLRMARKVRFHVRAEGSDYRPQVVPLRAGSAKLEVRAKAPEWWAELLGDRDATLATLGSAAEPLKPMPGEPEPELEPLATVDVSGLAVKPPTLNLPPPVTLDNKPKPPPEQEPPAPAAEVEAPRTVHRAPASSGGGLRLVSYGVLVAGAAAGGVGGYFGYQANTARQKIVGANQSNGVVTNLKQTDAYAYDATVTKDAPIANALFGTAGGLVLIGAVMWWFGGESGPQVSLSPAGISFSGVFQ